MKKTLVIALILISVCVSKPFEGYLINYGEQMAMKFQKDADQYDASDLATFFKNNIGTLETKATEQAQKLIEKYGKGNLFSPLQMNYMFIIEGLTSEQAKKTQIPNTVSVSFENDRSEGSLLEDIFDELKEDSVISNVNKHFDTEESRSPFYIYSSSNVFTNFFKYYGMTLDVKNTAQVDLYDTTIAKKYRISENIEQCVNEVFDKSYALRAREGYIYKINTFEKLQINSENILQVEEFLKDVCGISKLSKMFKKDEQPSFALFHINSLKNLQDKMSAEDFDFVLSVFRLVMKKTSKNFQKKFPNNVLGQVLFIDDSYAVAAEQLGEMTPSIALVKAADANPQPKRRRVLTETYANSTFDAATYSIFCWFSLVMVFALGYVCISLYTMDVGKDSLLYAKFLTADK